MAEIGRIHTHDLSMTHSLQRRVSKVSFVAILDLTATFYYFIYFFIYLINILTRLRRGQASRAIVSHVGEMHDFFLFPCVWDFFFFIFSLWSIVPGIGFDSSHGGGFHFFPSEAIFSGRWSPPQVSKYSLVQHSYQEKNEF